MNVAERPDGGLRPATFGSPDQGLRLGRAFASIQDPAVREAIVDLVEAMSKGSFMTGAKREP